MRKRDFSPARTTLIAFFCVWCLVGIAQGASKRTLGALDDAPVVPASPQRDIDGDGDRPQLLVSLANGQLLALDQDTGDTLWTFDTGAPLLTSTSPVASATVPEGGGVDDGNSPPPVLREGIFPGTDGSLYVYRADPDGKLPLGVRELVEASPAPTPDGSLVLGSQQSTVFVIDAAKGVLLRTLRGDESDTTLLMDQALLPQNIHTTDAEAAGEAAGEGDLMDDDDDSTLGSTESRKKERAPPSVKPKPPRILAIGRKDYIVRSVHPAFGEQWNVSWSQMQHLSALDIRRPSRGTATTTTPGGSSALPDDASLEASSLRLLVGPDHSLRRYDPGEGWEIWTRKFDAPPLAAYPASGAPIDLLEETTVALLGKGGDENGRGRGNDNASRPASQQPSQPPPQASLGGKNGGGGGGGGDSVIVGVMKGGLYGMKVVAPFAPGLSQECSSSPEDTENSNAAPSCDVFSGDTGAGGGEGEVAAHSPDGSDQQIEDTTAVALPFQQQPWWGGAVCSSPQSDMCAVPVGLFPIDQTCSDSTLLFLPPAASDSSGGGGGGERQGQSRGGGWWAVWGWAVVAGTGAVAFGFVVALKVRPQQQQQISSSTGTGEQQSSRSKKSGASKGKKSKQAGTAAKGTAVNGNTSGGPQGDPGLSQLQPQPQLLSQQQQPSSKDENGVTTVGRLRVGPGILGYGSGGTIVYEGELDGRAVAVKRLLRQFADLARKEIAALIVSDEHPNVVRCFALEEDSDFLYLALEKCICTLADAMSETGGKKRFVAQDGTPTPFAMRVAQDIGRGLEAVHARGIVHRDLKPHNVLLTESGRAKLSDMGLSKRLVAEQASFETVGSGGSPGWQAPEQLIIRGGGSARQTAAVDVFSFGLLVHYCLTGGKHPYGEGFERDAAIMHGRRSLDAVKGIPEAVDLLQAMLAAIPEHRPDVSAAMAHPLWWPAPRRLAFLIDVSDRVEGEDRAEDATLYAALEALSPEVVVGGSWATLLDSGLVNNLGKYRRYDFSSVRDLLRVVRNKHSHFRELPADLQERIGPIPDGFLHYFQVRFPRLLPACFYFALRWCAREPVFEKYFLPGAEGLLETAAPPFIRDPRAAEAALEAARLRLAHGDHTRPRVTVESGIIIPLDIIAAPVAVVSAGEGAQVALFPRRPGAPVCDFYGKTGHCRYGEMCKFDHPPEYAVKLSSKGLPLRPGMAVCTFYERTGECKFGAACKWDHPV